LSALEVAQEAKADMKGKVAIVTGCSTGLGKHTAAVLAQQGMTVIMASRNWDRIQAAAESIRGAAVNGGSLRPMLLDTSSMNSVRKFAQEFIALKLPLHVLINNAGIMAPPFAQSVDGFESQIATNHLGPFLLAYLLLPVLKASAPSRIIDLSSSLHKRSPAFSISALSPTAETYNGLQQYNLSKLANVLHVRELAKRIAGTGVTAYSVHPGVIRTELGRSNCLLNGCVCCFQCCPCFKSVPRGTATTIYCAVQPGIEKFSGHYFEDCHDSPPSQAGENDAFAASLWVASEKMIGVTSEERERAGFESRSDEKKIT